MRPPQSKGEHASLGIGGQSVPIDQDGTGDKDRRVRPGEHPNQESKGKSMQHLAPEEIERQQNEHGVP